MSKSGIAAQLKKLLVGRGRGFRAGGENLVRYLSVLIGNGDQVEGLLDMLTADELPDWLYVERDGRRITLIGLTAWRTDEAVTYEEVPSDADLWSVLGELYGANARLEQQLAAAQGTAREYKELCEQLTDPVGSASLSVPVAADLVAAEPCNHESLETELGVLRRKVIALTSANASKQALIESQGRERDAANVAKRAAETELESLRRQYSEILIGDLKLTMLVASSRRVDPRVLRLATEQLLQIRPLLSSLNVALPPDVQIYLDELEERLTA